MEFCENGSLYDLVIVGGGPAGANLARLVGASALSVLLIDGSQARGDKVCAGLLSPDAQASLARYDIELPPGVLSSPQLFSVRTVDLAEHGGPTRRYLRHYLNLDRAAFDGFLRSLVPDRVTVLHGVCRSVKASECGFALEVRVGESLHEIRTRRVVGADGATSVVRRCLFPERKIQKYVAIQEWFPPRNADTHYSCIFDKETSESCSWIFAKGDAVVFGGAFSPKNCRKAFEKQKEKLVRRGLLPDAPPFRTEACMVSRPHLLRGVFLGTEGAYLIGEAAGFISPSSFEGISYALDSSDALASALLAETASEKRKSTFARYRRAVAPLCRKVALKCLKHPFMYREALRTVILKTGIGAIPERKLPAPAFHSYEKGASNT